MTTPFKGWPAAAFDFYARLETDNSKPFWTANKAIYESAVKEPFTALSAALEDRFGALHLFRPNRDVRFSADKSPYKTAAGAVSETEGAATYYVQISAEGLFVGAGMYNLASDQLARWRTAVQHDRHGPAIAKIAADLESRGYSIAAMESLRSAPRGVAKDHPRIALLRLKGLTMGRSFAVAKWLHTAKALDRIVEVFTDAAPMNAWLERHVGPSNLPPPEFTR